LQWFHGKGLERKKEFKKGKIGGKKGEENSKAEDGQERLRSSDCFHCRVDHLQGWADRLKDRGETC
jgi:hypothetical protein